MDTSTKNPLIKEDDLILYGQEHTVAFTEITCSENIPPHKKAPVFIWSGIITVRDHSADEVLKRHFSTQDFWAIHFKDFTLEDMIFLTHSGFFRNSPKYSGIEFKDERAKHKVVEYLITSLFDPGNWSIATSQKQRRDDKVCIKPFNVDKIPDSFILNAGYISLIHEPKPGEPGRITS